MSLIYVDTDITTVGPGSVIAHGVNCRGKMGAGVAKAIRDKWPDVYECYMRTTEAVRIPKELLGSAHIIRVGWDTWVANCYTQLNYGREPGVQYASPDAIRQSVKFVYDFMHEDPNVDSFHFPKIGCALGGLDWESQVRPIFEELNKMYDKPTYIHEILRK